MNGKTYTISELVLILYVTGLLVWTIGRLFIGDKSLFILSFSFLGVWLFSPLLIFLPWALIIHNKASVYLLVFPVSLFLWLYGTMILPGGKQVSEPMNSITVISFNMMGSNTDTNAFLKILGSYPTEVFALQELTASSEETLTKALSESYPFQAFDKQSGLGVFSQFPMRDHKTHILESGSIQSIVIDVREKPLHLVNAHLARTGILKFFETWDTNFIRDSVIARSNQVASIKEIVDQTGMMAIVACDCNMTDLTSTYSQITSSLQDAYREQGWGFGHTFLIPRGFEISSKVNLPFQRIDYLFNSQRVRTVKIRVISEDIGSDHRPIWAQFDLGKSIITNQ
jgi:endonuclease/exonuclease/phosphatase (EEP) superfamily protein YafD